MLHKQLRKIRKNLRLLDDILTCLVRKHHTFQRRTFDAISVIDYKHDFFRDDIAIIMPPSLQKINVDNVNDSWFGLVRRAGSSYFLALRKVGSAIGVQICANGCPDVLNPVPAVTAAPVKSSMARTSTTPSLVSVSSP